MKKNIVSAQCQMELNLPRKPYARPILRRQRLLPGAHWWFTQMRQAVANAPEWGTTPASQTRQTELLCPAVS